MLFLNALFKTRCNYLFNITQYYTTRVMCTTLMKFLIMFSKSFSANIVSSLFKGSSAIGNAYNIIYNIQFSSIYTFPFRSTDIIIYVLYFILSLSAKNNLSVSIPKVFHFLSIYYFFYFFIVIVFCSIHSYDFLGTL